MGQEEIYLHNSLSLVCNRMESLEMKEIVMFVIKWLLFLFHRVREMTRFDFKYSVSICFNPYLKDHLQQRGVISSVSLLYFDGIWSWGRTKDPRTVLRYTNWITGQKLLVTWEHDTTVCCHGPPKIGVSKVGMLFCGRTKGVGLEQGKGVRI